MNIATKEIIDTYQVRDLRKFAQKNDLELVIPGDDQLQIDIDCSEDLETFNRHLLIFQEKFPGAIFTVTKSRSKLEGKHITITVPGKKFSVVERIAYQAALGSDRKRELLSLFDWDSGRKLPTVFFEKPLGCHWCGQTPCRVNCPVPTAKSLL